MNFTLENKFLFPKQWEIKISGYEKNIKIIILKITDINTTQLYFLAVAFVVDDFVASRSRERNLLMQFEEGHEIVKDN